MDTKTEVINLWRNMEAEYATASNEVLSSHHFINDSCLLCATTLEQINSEHTICPREIIFD